MYLAEKEEPVKHQKYFITREKRNKKTAMADTKPIRQIKK
jgi:hypothetical protein